MQESKKPTDKQMRDWVYNQVNNTDKAHDDIKKAFKAKFGSSNVSKFNKYVSDLVD